MLYIRNFFLTIKNKFKRVLTLCISFLKKHRKRIIGPIIFIIPVLIAIYFYYAPKISVAFSEPLNPQNAFTSPFLIKNESNLSIQNIKFLYKIYNIKATHPKIREITVSNFSILNYTLIKKNLNSNKTHTFYIDLTKPLLSLPPGLKTFDANLKLYITFDWFVLPC